VLRSLAFVRPEERFHIYGTLDDSFDKLGLTLQNVVWCGQLLNVAEADFGDYDGFVFTSLVEGMPNIVLELSQHAIPMVLANVGGLRYTFNDSAAAFVSHRPNAEDTAAAFSRALDRILSMTPDEVATMVTNSRKQGVALHSPHQYASAVVDLFCLQ
jgi:glycosyltransferase involved in cell wall biosynthesis